MTHKEPIARTGSKFSCSLVSKILVLDNYCLHYAIIATESKLTEMVGLAVKLRLKKMTTFSKEGKANSSSNLRAKVYSKSFPEIKKHIACLWFN